MSHNDESTKWTDKEIGKTVGVALDCDKGTLCVCFDGEVLDEKKHLAYEGIIFEGGLRPAVCFMDWGYIMCRFKPPSGENYFKNAPDHKSIFDFDVGKNEEFDNEETQNMDLGLSFKCIVGADMVTIEDEGLDFKALKGVENVESEDDSGAIPHDERDNHFSYRMRCQQGVPSIVAGVRVGRTDQDEPDSHAARAFYYEVTMVNVGGDDFAPNFEIDERNKDTAKLKKDRGGRFSCGWAKPGFAPDMLLRRGVGDDLNSWGYVPCQNSSSGSKYVHFRHGEVSKGESQHLEKEKNLDISLSLDHDFEVDQKLKADPQFQERDDDCRKLLSEGDIVGCLLLKREGPDARFDMFWGVKLKSGNDGLSKPDEVVWHKAPFTGIKTIESGVSPALTLHAHCEVLVNLDPNLKADNVLVDEAVHLASQWHADYLQTVAGTVCTEQKRTRTLNPDLIEHLNLIIEETNQDEASRAARGTSRVQKRQSRRPTLGPQQLRKSILPLQPRVESYEPNVPIKSPTGIEECLATIKENKTMYIKLAVDQGDPKASKTTADLVGRLIKEMQDGKLSFIKKIDMSEMTHLGDVLVARLATVIHYIDGLESLLLPRCSIGADGCTFLARYMASLPTLKDFDLSDNFCGTAMPRALLDLGSQGKCPLVRLFIDGVNLTYRGIGALCVLLNSCETLEELHICRNSLGMESALTEKKSAKADNYNDKDDSLSASVCNQVSIVSRGATSWKNRIFVLR